MAFRDILGNFHMTGYGSGGTYSVYYAFMPAVLYPFGSFSSNAMPVGLGSPQYPVELPGDYTRAGFGFETDGKAIVFWSGQVPGTGFRNLNVTGIATLRAASVNESGCSYAPGHGSGAGVRGILLLIPAALLGMRRRFRRHVAG